MSRMPQVVSKNLVSSGDRAGSSSASSRIDLLERDGYSGLAMWKRALAVSFHGAAASTYGYAICWQNVSQASQQLYMRSNPMVRVYGRWRFLTYNCLIMQFVAFSLCLTSHFVPRLRKPRDFFFTTFAFPVGMGVVSTFWAIWFYLGREYIFPASVEAYYPPWLNHITHTIILPINLIELIAIKKQYSSDKRSITTLSAYTLSYLSFLLYIRWQTGRFVYPFLNQMDSVGVSAFITGMVVYVVVMYKSGKLLHDCVHGLRRVKERLTSSPKDKKKH